MNNLNRANYLARIKDHPNSIDWELAKSELLLDCADRLICTLENSSKSADKLWNKVYWLNIILGILTFISTICAVIGVYFLL